MAGLLPAPVPGRESRAHPQPGTTDGPLVIERPIFQWTDAAPGGYRWSARLSNPSSGAFAVTVVLAVTTLDAATIHHDTRTRLLRGHQSWELDATGIIPEDRLPDAASWRIEYWVRIPPR